MAETSLISKMHEIDSAAASTLSKQTLDSLLLDVGHDPEVLYRLIHILGEYTKTGGALISNVKLKIGVFGFFPSNPVARFFIEALYTGPENLGHIAFAERSDAHPEDRQASYRKANEIFREISKGLGISFGWIHLVPQYFSNFQAYGYVRATIKLNEEGQEINFYLGQSPTINSSTP